jgi:hypothetical protein
MHPGSGFVAGTEQMMAARRHPTGEMTHKQGPEQPRNDDHERKVTLKFDELGWSSLEASAGRSARALHGLLSQGELHAPRAALTAPRFKPPDVGSAREVRLTLPPRRWRRLEDEAERQGVPLERLIEHASLLYLADVDAGRVAERVLERAEEDGDGA